MEDSKYYTPDISEFHVGFEYENFVKGKGWTKRIVRSLENVQFNEDDAVLDWDDYRVKHLDREDIESLGFELKNTVSDKLSIYHNNIDDFLRISCNYKNGYPYVSIYHYSGWETPDLIIKNKSELKRVLKQLNIIR